MRSVLVLAALTLSCGLGQADGGRTLPPSPAVAAPLHPWFPECSGLPSLGTEPRVRRGR